MRSARWHVVQVVALWIVLVGWALEAPVGSAPDDDYHLSSIWCAEGTSDVCAESTEQAREVPAGVVSASDCYGFNPEAPATCSEALVSGVAGSAL